MSKANIHPDYKPATIQCACGHVYESFSTRGSFMVEICANCHPFFTGKQKLMDTAGRIDRFNKKYGRAGASAQKDPKDQDKDKKAEPAAANAAEAKDETQA